MAFLTKDIIEVQPAEHAQQITDSELLPPGVFPLQFRQILGDRVSVGYRIMLVMLKAKDIRAIQSICPITPNHCTR